MDVLHVTYNRTATSKGDETDEIQLGHAVTEEPTLVEFVAPKFETLSTELTRLQYVARDVLPFVSTQ
ncbi:hypothetical protein CHS0354_032693, partial [Potamilus streckersoni]